MENTCCFLYKNKKIHVKNTGQPNPTQPTTRLTRPEPDPTRPFCHVYHQLSKSLFGKNESSLYVVITV